MNNLGHALTSALLRPEVAALALGALALLVLAVVWWARRGRRARPRGTGASAATGIATARPGHADVGVGATVEPTARLRRGLAKSREALAARLAPLLGRAHVDAQALADLEAALLGADVGVAMTSRLLAGLRRNGDDQPVRERLQREMVAILESAATKVATRPSTPWVIMVVGVNGAGKTTSIGKLAARYARAGRSVLLVAADTFRAAAIEQLAIWAERASAALVRQQQGSDPAAVVYDGMQAALARKVDVVIIDTAGRLHTKTNLMEELRKVRRIVERAVPGAPHETLLVLDAVTGQNGVAQARAFVDALQVNGVMLTKLDGTAKGGVVVAIAGELGLPIRYVGIGEDVEDLRDFAPREFVAALLGAEPDADRA
jgi:fused signal recognition particle receptor